MNHAGESSVSSTILKRLVDDAKRPKSKATAQRIHNACEYLIKHRIPISIPEIARLCERTGPKAQSIRNNRLFVAYINARRSEQIIPLQSTKAQAHSATKNTQMNGLIRALLFEAARERSQKENLIRVLRNLDGSDLSTFPELSTQKQLDRQRAEQRKLLGIAKRLLDPSHLRQFGLVIEGGRIFAPDRNNQEFLGKNHVNQLVRIIRASEGVHS